MSAEVGPGSRVVMILTVLGCCMFRSINSLWRAILIFPPGLPSRCSYVAQATIAGVGIAICVIAGVGVSIAGVSITVAGVDVVPAGVSDGLLHSRFGLGVSIIPPTLLFFFGLYVVYCFDFHLLYI